MREKLKDKIPNINNKQEGNRLKIDKPRGYTLKTIDPGIHNYVPQNKRRYIYARNV